MKGPVKCVSQGSLLVIIAAQLVHIGRGDSLATVSVRAGQNASLPCLGLATDAVSAPGGHIVNQLIWSRCSGRKTCMEIGQSNQLIIFANERVQVQQDGGRLGLDRENWSLVISNIEAGDTGIYSCAFNKQDSDHKIVQLLVLDVPERPGRPMVIRHGPRSSMLSWAPTIYIESPPVEYYVMQTRYGDSGPWPSVEAGQRTEGDENNITISGLTPFTVYTFRVVAVNDMGNSRPSETSYPVMTLRERPGVAPRLTHARNRSATSIEVGWEPPANYTLNGEHTGYRLTYRPLQPSRLPGTLTEVEIHRSELRKKVISGLEPFTKYEITLQVRNPAGTSPPDTVTAVTSQGVPSAPENVTLSVVTDRSLRVSWIPPRRPNGILLGYNVYWSQSATAVQNGSLQSGEGTSFTLTTLEPETRYSVWLRAFTAVGEGNSSEPVRLMTDVSGPGEPVITNITCPSDTSLLIYWQQPEIVYRSVDMYYLLYRNDDSGDFEQRTIPLRSDSLQFSVILPNLTAGEVYELRVQGATASRLIPNKVYKGQQSTPAKVRLERNCQQVQLVSTWRYQPESALSSSQLAGILVGCLLVIIIIVSTILWRRHRLKHCPMDSEVKLAAVAGRPPGWSAPSHEAVPARMFSQHVHQLHADGGAGLLRDWQSLQTAAPPADEIQTNGAAQVDGQMTRVQLSSSLYRGRAVPVPAVYHVDGYRTARAFIVTERPDADAASDAFWKLAWEQRVATVVLIGVPQSHGTPPLAPELGQTRPSGDLELSCTAQRLVAGSIITEVMVTKRKKERRLCLHHYMDCSESGLPDSPLLLLQLVRRTQSTASATATATATAAAAPVMIVTGPDARGPGLYLGLATLLTQLNRSQELAVLSYCQHIVGQCPRLLGTLEEFSLLHECLLERVSVGETLVSRDGAHIYLERLQGAGRDSFPYPTAERQYKSAVVLGVRDFTVVSAARPCNEAKNRSLSYIPMEPSRVHLPSEASLQGDGYINATWLPGYRVMQEYILTQHPLPSTVVDFWQMIWHHRVTTIACLSPEGCGVFWPSEEEAIRGPGFVIRYVSETADCSATYKTSWVIRSFNLQSTMGSGDVTARVVHLPLWPEECSIDSVMEAVVGVRDIQGDRQTPLVVMDRYGGTEGASFCLLNTVLRQLQQEASFDIFTVAKLYHQRRPGVWKNMREYLFLYHALEAWLATRGHGTLRRSGSCTSLCEDRTPTEVSLNGAHGVMV